MQSRVRAESRDSGDRGSRSSDGRRGQVCIEARSFNRGVLAMIAQTVAVKAAAVFDMVVQAHGIVGTIGGWGTMGANELTRIEAGWNLEGGIVEVWGNIKICVRRVGLDQDTESRQWGRGSCCGIGLAGRWGGLCQISCGERRRFPAVKDNVIQDRSEDGWWDGNVGGELRLNPIIHAELDKAEEGGTKVEFVLEEEVVGHLIGLEAMGEGTKGNDHRMVGTKDNGEEAVVTKEDIFKFKQADRKEKVLGLFEIEIFCHREPGNAKDLLGKNPSNVIGLGDAVLSGVTDAKNVDAGFNGVGVGLEFKSTKSFGHFGSANRGLGDAPGSQIRLRKVQVRADGSDIGFDTILGHVEPNSGEIQLAIALA